MDAPGVSNQTVRIITKEMLKDLELPQLAYGTISENYTSGDLPLIIPPEDEDPGLNDMVIMAYTANDPPAAGDLVVFSRVEGTRVIIGKVVHVEDLPAAPTDAETWRGIPWIEPGATEFVAHASEISTTEIDTWVTAKAFLLGNPGKYRITCELANSVNNNRMSARVLWNKEGNQIAASSEIAATGTSSYPTFAPTTTVNMTINVGMYSIILVQFKLTLGGTGYIKNISVKGQVATANPTLTFTALS